METMQMLRRQRKDQLIEKLAVAMKQLKEKDERLIWAALIGAVTGFLIGRGW